MGRRWWRRGRYVHYFAMTDDFDTLLTTYLSSLQSFLVFCLIGWGGDGGGGGGGGMYPN